MARAAKIAVLVGVGALAAWLSSSRGRAAVESIAASGALDPVFAMIGGPTRGERNNNPGNIVKSASPWQGKVAGTDSRFETFDTPENGIRALARLLKNYAGQGLDSVEAIISRYAPAGENDTGAYIRAVAQDVGVAPSDPLDLSDFATLRALVGAIITHENGRNVYADTGALDAGVQAA